MQTALSLLKSKWYWSAIAILGVAMISVALYYQYALGDEPCQVCIHIRIWVIAFTLLAGLMLLLPEQVPIRIVGHLMALVCYFGLAERCWFLYELENGTADGSCQFYLGFPEWFALDSWMPWLFEVRNLCSFTPELLFGVTMAEGLLLMAAGFIIVGMLALYSTASSFLGGN